MDGSPGRCLTHLNKCRMFMFMSYDQGLRDKSDLQSCVAPCMGSVLLCSNKRPPKLGGPAD